MKAGNRKNEGDVVKSFLNGELYRISKFGEKAVEIVPVEENESDEQELVSSRDRTNEDLIVKRIEEESEQKKLLF